jgi:hypothetical protein
MGGGAGAVSRGGKAIVKAVSKATKKNKDTGRQKIIDGMSTNYVANRSVKVRTSTNPSEAKRMNEFSTAKTKDRASGATAKRESAAVKQSKPAKVVKINSAPAKSADAAKKAADAKALKAANKPSKNKPAKKMSRQELNDSIKKQLSNRREQDKRNYPSN